LKSFLAVRGGIAAIPTVQPKYIYAAVIWKTHDDTPRISHTDGRRMGSAIKPVAAVAAIAVALAVGASAQAVFVGCTDPGYLPDAEGYAFGPMSMEECDVSSDT